jgi:hypothetical protein
MNRALSRDQAGSAMVRKKARKIAVFAIAVTIRKPSIL